MKDILRRNLGYKIISLIMAILFWLYVIMDQGSSQGQTGDQMTVPLVALGQPANTVVLSQMPSVRIRLQGKNPSLNTQDLYAYIDLSAGIPGEQSYPVEINLPPDLKLMDKQPSFVTVQLDEVIEKVLPVEVSLSGTPQTGFVAGTPVARPASVSVRGASTILNRLDKVVVEASLAGASQTVMVNSPVLFRDNEGKSVFGPNVGVNILNAYPSSVEIVVPIQGTGLSSKLLPIRVTSTGTPKEGMVLRSLVPTPNNVQVLGQPDALEGIEALNLGPVDISGLGEDTTFEIPLDKISLPEGVSFTTGTTLGVLAQIGPGPVNQIVGKVPIEVRNVASGLVVEHAILPIDVTLRGIPEVVQKVTPDQVQLWIDATGLAAGTYEDLSVYWQLPPGVEMAVPPKVTLALKSSQ